MITPRVCDKHGHDLEGDKKRKMESHEMLKVDQEHQVSAIKKGFEYFEKRLDLDDFGKNLFRL